MLSDAGDISTREIGQPARASRGMTIARWRDRPRKRAKTLTPINAYRDQALLCPTCAARELVFMGDRWGCDDCRGLFVEAAALGTLVEEMIGEPWVLPEAAGVPGGRSCPVCRAMMTVETLDIVMVDRCQAHGVWFDPTELEVVLVRESDAAKPKGIIGWLRRLF